MGCGLWAGTYVARTLGAPSKRVGPSYEVRIQSAERPSVSAVLPLLLPLPVVTCSGPLVLHAAVGRSTTALIFNLKTAEGIAAASVDVSSSSLTVSVPSRSTGSLSSVRVLKGYWLLIELLVLVVERAWSTEGHYSPDQTMSRYAYVHAYTDRKDTSP